MGRTGAGDQIKLDVKSTRTMATPPRRRMQPFAGSILPVAVGDSHRFNFREKIYDERRRSGVTVAQSY